MGLRDIVLVAVVLGSIPLIYVRPFFGVLVWYWISLMNPHRLSWELSELPLGQVVALAMLSSLLISQEQKQLPLNPVSTLLAALWFWMFVTTVFSFYPELAWWQWDKVWKIMLTTFVAMMVLTNRDRLVALAAVCAGSLAVYGVKGGIFTVATGGSYRVWGPPGSFIGGNNEIGLALIMVLPLLWFLGQLGATKWSRLLANGAIVLTFFAILGTQSRGAALGVFVTLGYLAWRSSFRGRFVILALAMIPVGLLILPEAWFERMETILSFQEDGSAIGRLRAWEMSIYLALDRPLLGGGFEVFKPATYAIYLPWNIRSTDAHSIYFEILGEHGFLGLALFLGVFAAAWRECAIAARLSAGIADLRWARLLAESVQVSFVGYAVTGAFLGLAYFDFYYALVAISFGLGIVVRRQVEQAGGASSGVGEEGASANAVPPVKSGMSGRAASGFSFAVAYQWVLTWWRRM